jgi:hypothetical protein
MQYLHENKQQSNNSSQIGGIGFAVRQDDIIPLDHLPALVLIQGGKSGVKTMNKQDHLQQIIKEELLQHLQSALQEHGKYDTIEKYLDKHPRDARSTIKEFGKVIQTSVNEYLKKKTQTEFPPKWLLKNQTISQKFDSDRIYIKVAEIMNYLWMWKMEQAEAKDLSESYNLDKCIVKIQSGKMKGEPDERYYVLINPNEPLGKLIAKNFNMAQTTAELYLTKFAEIGLIKKLKKLGSHGSMIYAIGAYDPWYEPIIKNGKTVMKQSRWSKPVAFWQKTDRGLRARIREGLKGFTVH